MTQSLPFPRWLAALILVWVVVVRAPFLGDMGEDSAFFAVVGARWLQGGLPYVASFDVKPPLMYAIFAALQLISPVTPLAVALLLDGFTVLATVVLARLAWREAGPAAALCVGLLLPAYSIVLTGDTRSDALAIVMFLSLAFGLARQSGRRAAFLCGAMVGLAAMIRQTSVIEGCAFAALLWFNRDKAFARTGLFVLGGVGVFMPVLALYAATGHLAVLLDDVVRLALQRNALDLAYATARVSGGMFILVSAFKVAMTAWPLTGLLGVAVPGFFRPGRPDGLTLRSASLFWALSVCAETALLEVKFPYYLIGLVPPLVLLCALALASFEKRTAAAFAIALALIAVTAELRARRDDRSTDRPDIIAATRAAGIIRANGFTSADGVLAVSRNMATTALLGATAGSPYFHPLHLLCPFPVPVLDPLAAALALKPRFITVSREDIAAPCELKDRHDELNAILARDYRQIGTASGRWDDIRVYARGAR